MQELDLLIDAAKAGVEIARRHFKSNPKVWEKEDGTGPVTQADLEVNACLEQKLRTARPDYGWMSEESPDDPARHAADRTFIVDPLDGTRAFIEGSRDFAIAMAVVARGNPESAVIALPARDMIFTATLGGGAHLNGEPLRPEPRTALEGAHVLTTRQTLFPEHWTALPPVTRHFRSSLAYRMALVAQGRFDAMLTLKASWEWDIAAGALIASEAHMRVTDRYGQKLRFNTPQRQVNGVVAGAPAVQSGLLRRLKA